MSKSGTLKVDPEQVRAIAEEERGRKRTKAQRLAAIASAAKANADGRAKAKAKRASEPAPQPAPPTPEQARAQLNRERGMHNLTYQLRECNDEAEVFPRPPDASHTVEEMREVAGIKRRQWVTEATNSLGISSADLCDALGVTLEVLESYMTNGSSSDTSDGAVMLRRLLHLVKTDQLETRSTWLGGRPRG